MMTKLEKSLTQDDLFCRVLYACFGMGFAHFSFSFVLDLVSQQFTAQPHWFYIGGWVLVFVCTLVTPVLLIQALAHPTSVAYILTKHAVPDAKGQRSRVLLNLFFLLPIVMITICLRAVGVHGYRV